MSNKANSEPFDFPQVIVVEASAGSGKTYSLAKRYISLLMKRAPGHQLASLREILAITFTNKAVIEMKERILGLLKRIAFDSFESKEQEEEILGVLNVGKKEAGQKAEYIIDEIIKHYNFFQVQTIDSFINTLLLGCALNIGRSAGFKIKREYSKQLSYCLDLVIEQGSGDKNVSGFLEEFLKHYLFVENKNGWFPKEDILNLARSLFKLSNKYGEPFQSHNSKSIDIIKKKKSVFSLIKELESQFPEGLNAAAAKSIRSFIKKDINTFSISLLPAVFAKPMAAMNKDKLTPPAFEKKWLKIHKELKELIELDSAASYNPYVKLFRALLDFFQDKSKKEDVLFLEELNHKARLLFDDQGLTVAELYYRLATRFRHYLIDEFQDTSLLQWHNLKIMVEEALASGGSLFYVGDKKQAIYRFRGGEAKLFDSLTKQFQIFNVNLKKLSKNWRSQKTIVEFNNRVFSRENIVKAINLSGIAEELEHSNKAVNEIADVFKGAAQDYREENTFGYVKVEHIDEKNQSQRDELIRPKILELIKELRKRFSYEDIALLMRDNNEVELVSSWLLEAGIPVESEKTLDAAQNPLIKDIVSFLKFLYSPIDDLSFASFILSDLFSLACGLSRPQAADFIFELRKERKLNAGAALYRLFRQRYPEIWDKYIDEFFKSVEFISLYELTVKFYARFEVLKHFSKAQAFFMKFLELIKEKEDECASLSDFLAYLEDAPAEDLYVSVTHSECVKALTIHKSKGLEFGVVIIPFLRIDVNPETGEKGTSSYVRGEESFTPLRLARITKNHRLYSDSLREVYVQGYKKACIDELNKVYVALTRAKHELYIYVPGKSAVKKNKARFFIPSNMGGLGGRKVYKRKQSRPREIINLPVSAYEGFGEFFKNEAVDISGIKNREKIVQGNIFHLILSCIDNFCYQDKAAVIKEAVEKAAVLYPAAVDSFFMREKASSLVDKEELKKFFYVSDGKVYREKEVVNKFGDIKRVDRLIIKERQAWIIDYKSSRENQEEHKKQVVEYMKIIGAVYPDLEVKGFIIYLDEITKEEVEV